MKTVLVTGVTGFLGGYVARALAASGIEVRGFGRDGRKGSLLEKEFGDGFQFVRGDLADRDSVGSACAGMDTVMHCGALSSPWGRNADFVRANVGGTRNVIDACKRHGVGRLVHVSTPGLYFRHGAGENVAEDAILPKAVNAYVRTKREAEVLVSEASSAGLETVVVRPRALIGAGDPSILPRLLKALEKGRLPVIGDGRNLTDLTCVENVADALMLAGTVTTDRCAGRIYNISNGAPVRLWELLSELAVDLGLEPPSRKISRPSAMVAAFVLETVSRITGREPVLSRYGVGVLSRTQTLDISAARRDLGFVPRVSVAEGLAKFRMWWKAGCPYPFFAEDGQV